MEPQRPLDNNQQLDQQPGFDGLVSSTTPAAVLDAPVEPIADAVDPMIEIKRRRSRVILLAIVPFLIAFSLVLLFGLRQYSINHADSTANQTTNSPTNELDQTALPKLNTELAEKEQPSSVSFSGEVILGGGIVLTPSDQPVAPSTGQLYYDVQSDQLRLYDGSTFRNIITGDNTQTICYVGANCGFLQASDLASITLPQPLGTGDSPTFAGLTLSGGLGVASGGTGVKSFNPNSVLLGNGTGPIGVTNTPAAGQILVADASGKPQFMTVTGSVSIDASGVATINPDTVGPSELQSSGVTAGTYGDGANYPVFTVDADGRITSASVLALPGGGAGVGSLNSLTGALTLQGTTNQIAVVSGGTTITLSTPQDIATTSSPTFNGLSLTSLTIAGDTVTDLTGTGLQVVANALQTTLGTSVDLGSEVTGTLPVANGGIGTTTLTANGVLIGNGTSAITSVVAGGTGLCLVSTAGSPSWQSCPGSGDVTTVNTFTGAITIQGTTNQISIANNAGTITVSTPQDIATGSSPTFNGLTLTSLTLGADTVTDITGTGLTIAGGALQTTLGTSIDLTTEVTGVLPIANGGTNASTAQGAINNLAGLTTTGDLLYYDGANATRLPRGTNGQCLLSNATTILWTTCTGDGTGVTTIGSLDGGTLSADGASISGTTLYLQSASDTFPGIVNTGSQTFAGTKTFSDGLVVTTAQSITINGEAFTDLTGDGLQFSTGSLAVDATVCRTSGNCVGGGGGGAPNGAAYLTVGNDGTLSAERAITAGTNLSATDGGANSTYTLNVVNNPTFSGLITGSAGLTIAAGQTFTFNTDAFTDLTGTGLTISGGALQTTLGTSVDLTAEITGILPIANGGTNASTSQGAINNLSQLTTTGDLLYFNGTNSTRLARGSNGQCLLSNTTTILWTACTGDGGVTTVGAFDTQTPSANGAVIAGTSIYLQSASATNPGLVNTSTQTFAGDKTFTDNLSVDGTGTFGTNLTVGNGTGNTFIALNISATGTSSIDFYQNNGTNLLQFDKNTDTFTLKRGGVAQLTLSSAALNLVYGNLTIGTSDTTGQLLVLDTKTDTGDPSGQNGGMYYNSFSGKFRCYENGAWADCISAGDGTGVTAVGTIDSQTPSADGAVISGSSIYLQSASTSNPGLINTTTQSFAGDKTFTGTLTVTAAPPNSANGSIVSVSGTTTSSTQDQFGTRSVLTVTPGASAANRIFAGIDAQANATNSNIASSTWIAGVRGTGLQSSGTTTAKIAGGYFGASNTSSGAVSGYGVYLQNNANSSGMANSYGAYIDNALGTGVTNQYGLYINSLTSGTNNYGLVIAGASSYAIRVDSGLSQFSGDVRLYGTNTTIGDANTDLLTVSAVLQGTNALVFEGSSADANETTFAITNPTADRTITFPNETGTVCTTGSVCSGYQATMSIGTINSQTKSANGAVIASNSIVLQTADASNVGLVSTGTQTFAGAKTFTGDVDVSTLVVDGNANALELYAGALGQNAFVYGNNGLDVIGQDELVLSTDGAGDVYLGICFGSCPSTVTIGDNAGATTTINGSTLSLQSGSNIELGTSDATGTLLVLDTKTGAGDPTGVNGGMYYNSNSGKFRCYQASAWTDCISSSGVTTLAVIGSSPNANGATISGSTLNLQPASASFGGVVTIGTQSFAGDKTFTGNAAVSGNLTVDTNTLFVDATNNRIGIGTTTTSQAGVLINLAAPDTSNGAVFGVSGTLSSTTNGLFGIGVQPTVTVGSSSDLDFAGIASAPTTATGNLNTGTAGLFGYLAAPVYTGTGTLLNLVGTTTTLVNGSTGTVTNGTSIEVTNPVNAGTITNNIGLLIYNQTAGTTDYGVYIQGADTYALFVDAGATRLDGTLLVGGLATLQGGVTAPGAGSNSEAFGSGALANGQDSTALGYNASAGSNSSIAIGSGATVDNAGNGVGEGSIAIGFAANTVNKMSVALGSYSYTQGDAAVAIGNGANANALNAVSLGVRAESYQEAVAIGGDSYSDQKGVAIGQNAAAGDSSVSLGHDSNASNNFSIAIGRAATTTASNQLVIGSDLFGLTYISDAYIGAGIASGNAASRDITLHATSGDGTDIGGADLLFAGGQGTGTGAGGSIVFQTASAGSTGSSLNSLTTRWSVTSDGHFLPGTDDTYDIGSDTNRVRDLYLGPSTLHIGTSTSDEATFSYNNSTDTIVLKNATNSAAAFQIQNSSGATLFNADTSNNKLEVYGEVYSRGLAWTARTGAAGNYNAITYGNGIFVAVSSSGAMTSPDGVNWTARTVPASNSWNSVTYGSGLFVAVGSSGTGNRVMTSPDGITWTLRSSAAGNSWTSVTYGNGMFVAVSSTGTGNRVMTSPDGITWTSRTSAADNSWRSVTYGNGLFVAVAASGTGNRVMTSPDGITWTSRTSAVDNGWDSVTYGNGLFVAVSFDGTGNGVMTSPDGITWTSRTPAANNAWLAVTYGSGLFVAVGGTGTGNRVMTSPDGITWTTKTSPADYNWISVTYGNGMFITVNNSGVSNNVMTSGKAEASVASTNNLYQGGIAVSGGASFGNSGIDGWTIRTSAADNGWNSVAYGNNLYVAVSSTGTGNRVMTSPDGITWTSRTSTADNTWNSVAYGNGLFVAVSSTGTGNRVMTSPDGITWTGRTSAADNSWQSVTYANGLFVAVAFTGSGNRVMTSPDGITWTIRSSAADNNWVSVTYGNGLFVAVANTGTGNRVMTSPDGITWTIRTSAADNNWRSVTYGNGLFVAIATTGTGNRVMTSPDGITWTIRTSAADDNWQSVTYGNGLYIAVSNVGTAGFRVMTSPDGITWTLRSSAADNGWNSVTYGNGLFVAVAASGTGNRVMTSTGKLAALTSSGSVVLQDTLSVTGQAIFAGTISYVAGTADTNTAVCRNSQGQLAACTSSQRYKSDVTSLNMGLNELRQLQPVSYTWNTTGQQDVGFIAEQVALIIPQAVTYNANGEVASFNPNTITALLTSALQELDIKVQSLETRLIAVEQGQFAGNITVAGKIISAGNAALAVLGTDAAANSTITISGNDTAGTVTYVAGAAGSVAGEHIKVVFNAPYGAQPRVTLTPTSQAAGQIRFYVERTANDFKVIFIDAPTVGQTYTFDYQIIQ